MTDEPAAPDTTVEQSASHATAGAGSGPIDLERIERDLAGVEAALERLDQGTYWTDEVTGAPIPDDVLAADPVARRGLIEP